MGYDEFKTLKVSCPAQGVLQVELNRPKKLNAMNKLFWKEMRECFSLVENDGAVRCVLLSAAGRAFTAGLDLMDVDITAISGGGDNNDPGRAGFKFVRDVAQMQESFSILNKIPQPVIACVHGACVGGGIDMITAADIRLCTADAWFTIKEIDIGITADVGTLQRLPKITGNDSLVRELAFSGRKIGAEEAQRLGLVSHVHKDRDTMLQSALHLATTIASKSPLAVAGTKHALNYSREHNTQDSLHQVLLWNTWALRSEDVQKAAQAFLMKQTPKFRSLL